MKKRRDRKAWREESSENLRVEVPGKVIERSGVIVEGDMDDEEIEDTVGVSTIVIRDHDLKSIEEFCALYVITSISRSFGTRI
jgi:hypothetical protein